MKIDQNMSVGELKEVIREKQQYQLPASTMELFQEEKDNGKWVADKVEGGVDVTEYMTQLDNAEARLNSVGLSSDTAGSGNDRVWVKLSTTSSIGRVTSVHCSSGASQRLDGVKQLMTTIKMLQADAELVGHWEDTNGIQPPGCDVFHMLCTAQGERPTTVCVRILRPTVGGIQSVHR